MVESPTENLIRRMKELQHKSAHIVKRMEFILPRVKESEQLSSMIQEAKEIHKTIKRKRYEYLNGNSTLQE